MLKRFTTDSIWSCAFGININLQKNDDQIQVMNRVEDANQNIIKYNFPMYLTSNLFNLEFFIYS